jgi:drug/metabolite transporter (DMT)-like permease
VPNAVVLGLATAVAWGTADFFARFATRSVGSVRALFGMQSFGAIFATIYLIVSHDYGHLFDGSGWQPWAMGISVGIAITGAMLALYRAFETGKLSLVAPISASYPALTVLLSMLSGEKLSLPRIAGIFVVVLGVILVAAGEKSSASHPSETKSPARSALGYATLASVLFGILFWLLGVKIIPRVGTLATLWLIRIAGTAFTLCLVIAAKAPLRLANRRTTAQLYTIGFFDTTGFAFSNLGMRLQQVAVVSVLGSLYGAVTVALAALFLKERISPLQWIGIAAIFAGVTLINL